MEQGCEFAMYWRAPQFQLKTLRQPSVVCISVDLGTSVLRLVWVGALKVVPDKARHEKMDPVEISCICGQKHDLRPEHKSQKNWHLPETDFIIEYEEELLAKCLYINNSPSNKLL